MAKDKTSRPSKKYAIPNRNWMSAMIATPLGLLDGLIPSNLDFSPF